MIILKTSGNLFVVDKYSFKKGTEVWLTKHLIFA